MIALINVRMVEEGCGCGAWGYMLYIYKESNSRSKLGLFLMCSLNLGFAKYFVFSASTLNITSCAVVGFESEVNESHFFNLETRMRISPDQSRTSRRYENFLHLISGFEIKIYYLHSQATRREREFF